MLNEYITSSYTRNMNEDMNMHVGCMYLNQYMYSLFPIVLLFTKY